jgi:ABC-type uncharacterized transport system substrate-binding protein
MFRFLRAPLAAMCLVVASSQAAFAGDYDQALYVLSKAFPKASNVGVFYDSQGTLLNLLEFEGSAFKQFGVSIKLVPINKARYLTAERIRSICTENRIQALLLLEDDTLFTPGSPAGIMLVHGAGSLPVAAANADWLREGAWFAIGPNTKGLQLGKRVKDEKVRAALQAAAKAAPPPAN